MARSQTAAFVLGVLAALFWSPHLPTIATALRGSTSLLVLHFYVVLWAAAVCFVVLLALGRLEELNVFKRRESQFIVLIATGGYGLWLLRTFALEAAGADSSHVYILFYLAPFMLGILTFLTREKAQGRQIAALALGFVGCILIASSPPSEAGPSPTGVWLIAAAAAACWAVFSLMARRVVQEENVLPVSALIWGVGAVCLLVTCLVTGESVLDISRETLLTSVLLGVVTVALAFGCWLKCLAEASAAFVSPLWYLALVFGFLLGYHLPGTRVGWWSIAGCLLILVAVYLARTARRRAQMTMSDLIRG